MALYSIKEETLVDIGDALRRKHGETEIVTIEAPTQVCRLSSWQKDFNSYTTSINAYGKIDKYTVHTIPNATTIYMKIGTETKTPNAFVEIASGNLKEMPEDAIKLYGEHQINYYTFENTDSITIHFYKPNIDTGDGLGYYAEIVGFDADGNPVGDDEIKEAEIKVKKTYNSSEMAQAIDDIEVGTILPEEAFVVTGPCMYRFSYGGWDWFVNLYGNKMTSIDIITAGNMFSNATTIEYIPFEINFKKNSETGITSIFDSCYALKEVPKINNLIPSNMSKMFTSCYSIRYIPEDIASWFDWSYMDKQTSSYNGDRSSTFSKCYSLRYVPVDFFTHVNKVSYQSYTYFSYGFMDCSSLDALTDLPISYTANYTSNMFNSTFSGCSRLKNLTFAMPDGLPYIKSWKSQTIDLTNYIGYSSNSVKRYILNYNSGITEDKEVTDDATYQALKNDPDWWTTDIAYSRYNHDSAVATINSLPDTSAYLATAGGTNTIKFRGASGELTDGGAINTLTEEEIAVATARGWTVTLA